VGKNYKQWRIFEINSLFWTNLNLITNLIPKAYVQQSIFSM